MPLHPVSSVPGAADPVRTTKKHPTWMKATASAVLIAAAIGSVVAWRASTAKKIDKKPDAEKVFEFAPSDLAQVQGRQIGRRIPVSGSMRPVTVATVKSKLAAEITQVHVKEGERVSAGQLLVTLDTGDLKARLDALLASVAEARARLSLATKNQDTNQQLLAKNFISQNAVDATQSGVDVAQANVKAAEAQAAIASRAVADARVRAPFSGIVAKRMVNGGEKVSPDSPLLQIVDLSQMEIEAPVPVAEIALIKLGQDISFKVDGFDDRAFNGKVGRINPVAEPGTRAISVFVTLPNADAALRGGMFATGKALITGGSAVNSLPGVAIHEEGGQSFVFTIKDGQLDRRPVSVGSKSGESEFVEILEGLSVGTEVVAVRTDGLKQGAKAFVKNATAPAAKPKG